MKLTNLFEQAEYVGRFQPQPIIKSLRVIGLKQ